MISGLIDFALNNRWLVLGAAILLFGWGVISFHTFITWRMRAQCCKRH
jgi:Cu/Ag efflux pump CusA